ncbi:transmembrane protein 131-like isoform X1 [Echeneis naucrates]|uniref:transmembrane protein 131-like isoform X1 n=1 Tax=Echeneis naucrates TaxID=173247 RepID=UPI001113BDA0|nr:transmembrane protein 131-like isoform X1 [Echeneis naucrates]XP_029368498.1 transmembrane protein 131-like isoform X1 [Echeneis naucrates]
MAGLQDFHQGSHCHRKTWINILLGILQLLLPCFHHGGAQLQALSQMSTSVVEVWQAEDADPLVPLQVEKERRKDGIPREDSSSPYTNDNGRPLHFQPPAMEFRAQPLGLPRAETIYIHNPSQEVPVTLLSMFTSSRHFYVPSFHRRVIPPRGKASFKVIFLPSEEGNVENTLFINTSASAHHGLLSYQVFGVGVNQGSLKSVQRKDSLLIFPHIQSIKLTQTQEDTSNITILGLLLECNLPQSLFNNPQGSCLQSEEHLSLQINLSAHGDRPTDLDKLKPYVIEHILVLLVAPNAGQTAVEPKMRVHMLNSGGKKLYVKEMQVLSKVEASLEFNQVLLKPEAKNFTEVATLVCRDSLPGHGRKCVSHISLKILGNRTSYRFPGLHITHSLFHVKQRGADQVDLWLSNPLLLPLTVTNASLSQKRQRVMKMTNFSGPLTIPQGCWQILSLQLLSKTQPVNQLCTLSLDTSLGSALHIPLYIHSSLSKHGHVVLEAERECGRPCPLRLSEAGHSEWQRSLLPDFSSSAWAVDSKLAAELCFRWQSQKDKLPCRWPRLLLETSTHLDFGATPVNESKVKTFMLKNPSSSIVSVEIRILSLYPAPLEALDLLTKWFNVSPLSVNISTTQFSLLTSPPKAGENVEDIAQEDVLHLLLQPWEAREVAVVFTPYEHKPTTTILIIRNNLTVFDMVKVQGHGAKELLRVGGKLPGLGASLRFNVPQSTLMECRDGLRPNKPLFAIRKSFKVENAGELPLTVMSMNINGYKCQGFGFEVLQCHSFSLDHNTSSEITIAFTPDFTSSWVIRDLTLVTSRGTSFPFILNVTLPHHMLPLCAQVVPGPSWEETFWVITLIFTCFSLFGVCLMAFRQAHYILNDFSTPSIRSNHNSVLSRDNGAINTITPNGVNKTKGSCKSYVDTCHTSDKGKGRGSPALANSPTQRLQSSKKSSSTTPAQPQKKHKVSLYYTKYKSSFSTAAAGAVRMDEEDEDLTPNAPLTLEPDICNNNEPAFINELDKKISPDVKEDSCSTIEDSVPTVMFPMEMPAGFPDNITLHPGPRPGLLVCSSVEKSCTEHYAGKIGSEKRDSAELEVREDAKAQKKKAPSTEASNVPGHNKGKSRRRKTENLSSAPEHNVLVMPEKEKEPDWRTGDSNSSGTHNRNRYCNFSKSEALKPGHSPESPIKQNGVCPTRTRRKCATERRGGGVCESGSDSGSSSGSVRASRGSWGSWSSTSSMEGDKDPNARTHACTTSSRKRDSMQYGVYPVERDCYQTMNTNHKALSMNSLYRKDVCQSPDPPASTFAPSFAAVAAGVDRNIDLTAQYLPEETWSAPSIPLTNEFRYNTTEALPYIPQPATTGSYNGFTWSTSNSHCNSPYTYCEEAHYIGNGTFSSGFAGQEGQNAHSNHTSWNEEQPQDSPSTWDTAACVGSKPYFPGTRSLSPMSSLFGSIWTPQSEPYQSHFQPERSAPISPVSPITPPHSPYSREGEGTCRPTHYSSFHPFGPHMNLDIWNSSSNRSSNSQLSNDSGYCGDV